MSTIDPNQGVSGSDKTTGDVLGGGIRRILSLKLIFLILISFFSFKTRKDWMAPPWRRPILQASIC